MILSEASPDIQRDLEADVGFGSLASLGQSLHVQSNWGFFFSWQNVVFQGCLWDIKDKKICVPLVTELLQTSSSFSLRCPIIGWDRNFQCEQFLGGPLSPWAPRVSPGGRHILLQSLSWCTLQAPLAMKSAVVTDGCCCPLGIFWEPSLSIGWSPVQAPRSWWMWLPHTWTRHGEPPLCPGRGEWENLYRFSNLLRAPRHVHKRGFDVLFPASLAT